MSFESDDDFEKSENIEENYKPKNNRLPLDDQLFDAISEIIIIYRKYIHENGLPLIEEISYEDLHMFLNESLQ
jgi:hypothetical protein